MSKISRRHFLRSSGAVMLGFSGLHTFFANSAFGQDPVSSIPFGYGDLIPDPNGIIDLPEVFTYQVISRTGDSMDDGLLVPGNHDGMAAFPGPGGKTILIRNHENTASGSSAFGVRNELLGQVDQKLLYDAGNGTRPALGGTTTLVYDTNTALLESHYLSLAGTMRNCAGGPTPWNSWITCEENLQRAAGTFEKVHGYNFEVPASTTVGLVTPVPLKTMGRFNHEAIAVHPDSGIVYQTEDRSDGLIYRFILDRPGNLAIGGRLQALKIRGMNSADTRNWVNQTILSDQLMDVEWLDIENVESPNDDLRFQGFGNGAARFARGEGMWYGRDAKYGRDAIYFACTSGGSRQVGQIWRYMPSPFEGTPDENRQPGQLALFIEPNNSALLEKVDNVTVSPWGDLILCEDGSGEQFLVGVTPQGETYKFAKNAMNSSEFAGATFSPDGSTLFVNIQSPGLTLALTGPWHRPIVAVEPRGKLTTTFGEVKRSALLQNYPNPFNPETWIPFRLEQDAHVEIHIYSTAGDLVRKLDLGHKPVGVYENQSKAAYWDGRNEAGELVSSGVYFYQMRTDSFRAMKKLVVRK